MSLGHDQNGCRGSLDPLPARGAEIHVGMQREQVCCLPTLTHLSHALTRHVPLRPASAHAVRTAARSLWDGRSGTPVGHALEERMNSRSGGGRLTGARIVRSHAVLAECVLRRVTAHIRRARKTPHVHLLLRICELVKCY